MPTNVQSRAQYLAVAEFCQSVIEGLMDLVESDAVTVAASLKAKLRGALTSFEAISSGDLHAFARSGTSPFRTFEQVRTLQEVWGSADLQKSAQLIRAILESRLDKSSRSEHARKLIDLFARLQTRALWNFRQPRPYLPKSFRELCRVL